jgi:hypothetical protein
MRDMGDAAVIRFFRSDYLQLAYTMNASLKHIPLLAHLRNRRRSS